MRESLWIFASGPDIDDAGPDGANRKAILRDPVFRRLYQGGRVGHPCSCFACMSVCPAGREETT